MPAGTLYVVATPIGNLEDLSPRAKRVLKEVRVIACEDTRTTKRLLDRYGIVSTLVSYHEHNEAARSEELRARLVAGEDVALVTDAGTPLVSDPGRRLVQRAIDDEVAVVPIPGPAAFVAAISVSGLDATRFTFCGFPPRSGREREAFLDEVVESAVTTVLYESPHRIARTLAELAARAPDRPASLHRELTKLHEETRRGDLATLAAAVASSPARGEYTLVVAGAPAEPASVEEAIREAQALVGEGTAASQAAREVARRRGVSRRAVYQALIREADEIG